MNRITETGVMLFVFMIAINGFIAGFGPDVVCGGQSDCLDTMPLNITRTDVNAVVSAGEGVTKSGDPFTSGPSELVKANIGSVTLQDRMGLFVDGYKRVLLQILPSELAFFVEILYWILTCIQLAALMYLIAKGASIVFGGGGD